MTRPAELPGAPVERLADEARPVNLLRKLQCAAAVVRRMIGVPDYDTYLAHMREHYPECTPLDPRTFERERLTARYKATGSRCC
jgi:uncharacterized short protein YbdD (DUF466 family)